jgi:general secretion pathway protein G
MKKMQKRKFTLIEVVIVIVILVTLASIATPMYFSYMRDANIGAAKQQIANFSQAIDKYEMDTKSYPSEEAGLQALLENVDGVEEDSWKRPYLKVNTLPKDPWGRDYVYRRLEDDSKFQYEVLSYGKDGEPGGEGENADISSLGEAAEE